MDEKTINAIARIFAALANPQRIQIILKLMEDPRCHTDIASCVPIDVSTVWRHVKKLENAGLVETRREGKRVFVYPCQPHRIRRLLNVASEIARAATTSPR